MISIPLPTPEEPKHTRKLKYWIALLVTAGLLYTSGSILVMNHLVQENNAFCQQRQAARSGIRLLFERDPDWEAEDQILLDQTLPEIVNC